MPFQDCLSRGRLETASSRNTENFPGKEAETLLEMLRETAILPRESAFSLPLKLQHKSDSGLKADHALEKNRTDFMDILALNGKAWEEKARRKNPWTVPVDHEIIARARRGDWSIMLTASRPAPRAWFPPVKDKNILCLASGGGQQGPVLAAAGADVTVLDLSEAQLERDRAVARREGLEIRTVLSSMTDLCMFADNYFDIIVHPVSNLFIPHIQPVWNEAFRVLKKGGVLMSGFMNPAFYLFDWELQEQDILQVSHPLPYSDLDYRSMEELTQDHEAAEFGHSLEEQIQGQLAAGFVLTALYEDTFGGTRLPDRFFPSFLATRAVKLQRASSY